MPKIHIYRTGRYFETTEWTSEEKELWVSYCELINDVFGLCYTNNWEHAKYAFLNHKHRWLLPTEYLERFKFLFKIKDTNA